MVEYGELLFKVVRLELDEQEVIVRAGNFEVCKAAFDSSFIWWAVRPSRLNPTLELRAPDTCTFVEDSLAIAALYRTIARHLCFNPWRNAELDAGGAVYLPDRAFGVALGCASDLQVEGGLIIRRADSSSTRSRRRSLFLRCWSYRGKSILWPRSRLN